MAKRFRPWTVDQAWLLPPSVQEFVPAGHLAHFVRETVRNELDLGAIVGEYDEERGNPPFHPAMMTALLLYGYCRGVYSSRSLAVACRERMDFAAVTAMQKPDFRTINLFRKRHLLALAGLFQQVLLLCDEAGLVSLGHVAIDSSPVAANASKDKSMSYKRMKTKIPELEKRVAEWFRKAESADEEEDRIHGDRQGDELPEGLRTTQEQLAKIRAAKARLEAEAKAAYDKGPIDQSLGTHPTGPRTETPKDNASHNFTDPDSKVIKTRNGFEQAFRTQLVVDALGQIIVAHDVSQKNGDAPWLLPLLDQVKRNLGRNPAEASADCGYCSESNLRALRRRRIAAYIATEAVRHRDVPTKKRKYAQTNSREVRRMRQRLRRAGWRSRYRIRKQTVEPVFGQIKEPRRFRRFSLRSLDKVKAEWALVSTAHNLLKLSKHWN
jgi:transposase